MTNNQTEERNKINVTVFFLNALFFEIKSII